MILKVMTVMGSGSGDGSDNGDSGDGSDAGQAAINGSVDLCVNSFLPNTVLPVHPVELFSPPSDSALSV